MFAIVTASCAVSNMESRYPRANPTRNNIHFSFEEVRTDGRGAAGRGQQPDCPAECAVGLGRYFHRVHVACCCHFICLAMENPGEASGSRGGYETACQCITAARQQPDAVRQDAFFSQEFNNPGCGWSYCTHSKCRINYATSTNRNCTLQDSGRGCVK